MDKRTNIAAATPFIPLAQHRHIASALAGEEGAWFFSKLAELASTITGMPKLYQTDKQGDDALALLHYFAPNGDWWITESNGPDDCFGLADLGERELGYIDVAELCRHPLVELDLHWTPRTIGALRNAK
jgi:hypothetical protein